MALDILIVDDEADIRMIIAGVLNDEGYNARESVDADSALEAIRSRRPNLVILDVWLQGSRLDGLQLLDEIKTSHPDLPVIMISGHGTVEMAVNSIKRGAYDFIEKPFKADRLLHLVDRATETARLRQENAELRQIASVDSEIMGNSQSIQILRQQIEKAAPTGSRVVFNGPAGSGKEIAARQLHRLSRRADGPFVVINCAALHPDRLEIELFGVEGEKAKEGTGRRKVGVLEQAHGGTLLLDEVSDMPVETQGKIVRVLQDQSFTRVGGTTKVEVDVRIVASTTADLQEGIIDGTFREDLFYRLNVVPIEVPPLSQRRQDIELLARHFIERASEVQGLPARDLADDAIVALQSYDWPGNVRQLRNVIDWILIMSTGESGSPIRADMLPPEVGEQAPAALRSDSGSEIMTMPLRDAR
ncbi:MAG: sigma-54 dependent transcriptional regulator, partial [Pseudomonadota bacterium]